MWTLAAVLALPEPFMSNVIPSSESSQEPRNHFKDEKEIANAMSKRKVGKVVQNTWKTLKIL